MHTAKCGAEQGLPSISPPRTESVSKEIWVLPLDLQ